MGNEGEREPMVKLMNGPDDDEIKSSSSRPRLKRSVMNADQQGGRFFLGLILVLFWVLFDRCGGEECPARVKRKEVRTASSQAIR